MADSGPTAAILTASSAHSLPDASVDQSERPGKRQKLNPPPLMLATDQPKSRKSPPPAQTSAPPTSTQSTAPSIAPAQNETNKADMAAAAAAAATAIATAAAAAAASASASASASAPAPAPAPADPATNLNTSDEAGAGDLQAHASPVSLSSIATLDSVPGPTVMTTTVGSPLPMDDTAGLSSSSAAAAAAAATAAASLNANKGLSTPENDHKAMSYPAPFLTPQLNNDARRGMSLPHSATRQGTRSPSGKKHKCPYCATEFTRHHNLKSHLLTHSQEKPYVCPTCQSRFRRLHDLKRHSKLHTGERPHVCPKCRRKFARGDALARHNKGPGGCAGRRASMGSFGGTDGGFEGADDMDGSVVYGEPESFEEEEGNDTRPGIRRQAPSGDDSHDGTVSSSGGGGGGAQSRIPSTYPPIQGRPQGGIATGHFPPRGGFGPPLVGPVSPSGAGPSSNPPSLGAYPSHPGSTSSRYPSGSYAANAITESPRPLSPGQSRGGSGPIDHRNRSPTMTSYGQGPGSSFGRGTTASASSLILSNPATQLPPPPGFLPSQTGPTHPPTQPTGPPTHMGSGPLSSNSNSLSSHGQSGHGSVETSSPMFAKDDRIWAYVKSLEQRMNGMQEEINGLRAQLVSQGQRLA